MAKTEIFKASDFKDAAAWREHLDREGYVIVRDVLTPAYIAQAKKDLEAAMEKEAAYHGGKNYQDYGMVMMCAKYGQSMIDLYDNDALMAPFNALLNPDCIVYAYTSSSMPPQKTNYSFRIHVDSPRLIPGYATNMGATIALDDFTEDNGATYYLPRSHTRATAPTEEEFFRDSIRFVAPAGSVAFFNARLWHSGGQNKTDKWRHALTINMCRIYMKQRLDIPRMMEAEGIAVTSQKARQKLGFDAQVPASYDEYYAPPEKRKFKTKEIV